MIRDMQEEDTLWAPWLHSPVMGKNLVQWFAKAQEIGVNQDQHASQVMKMKMYSIDVCHFDIYLSCFTYL